MIWFFTGRLVYFVYNVISYCLDLYMRLSFAKDEEICHCLVYLPHIERHYISTFFNLDSLNARLKKFAVLIDACSSFGPALQRSYYFLQISFLSVLLAISLQSTKIKEFFGTYLKEHAGCAYN